MIENATVSGRNATSTTINLASPSIPPNTRQRSRTRQTPIQAVRSAKPSPFRRDDGFLNPQTGGGADATDTDYAEEKRLDGRVGVGDNQGNEVQSCHVAVARVGLFTGLITEKRGLIYVR